MIAALFLLACQGEAADTAPDCSGGPWSPPSAALFGCDEDGCWP